MTHPAPRFTSAQQLFDHVLLAQGRPATAEVPRPIGEGTVTVPRYVAGDLRAQAEDFIGEPTFWARFYGERWGLSVAVLDEREAA